MKKLIVLALPFAALLLLGFGGGPSIHRPSTGGGGGGATDWTQGAPTIYNDGPIGIGNDPQFPACVDGGVGDLVVDDDIAVNGNLVAFAGSGAVGNCADGTGVTEVVVGPGSTPGYAIGSHLYTSENGAFGIAELNAGDSDEGYVKIQAQDAAHLTGNRFFVLGPLQTTVALDGMFNFSHSSPALPDPEPWVKFEEGIDLKFEGDTADPFEATFGAAQGLVTDMTFLLPPNMGNNGEFLQTDGAGNTSWVAVGASAWAAGVNGLFYNGDGVIVGADAAFCAADGGAGDLRVADDLEVAGGEFFVCDNGVDSTFTVAVDTTDAADHERMFFRFGTGGAFITRGASLSMHGNEFSTTGGSFVAHAGDVGGGVADTCDIGDACINSNNTTSGEVLLRAAESGTGNMLGVSPAGFRILSATGDDFFYGEDIDIILEGDTDDANETTLRAANGLAADTLFATPATNGSSGDVLTSDGSGITSWTTAWANGSATIDFANTTATTVDSSDIAVTGADTGDICVVSAGTAAYVTGATFTCYVASAGNVKVRFAASGANIDPASATFNVRVFDP